MNKEKDIEYKNTLRILNTIIAFWLVITALVIAVLINHYLSTDDNPRDYTHIYYAPRKGENHG